MSASFENHLKSMKDAPVIYHRDHLTSSDDPRINWHDNMEILLMRTGRGRIVCDAGAYDVCAGNVVVINSQEVHSFFPDDEMEYDCFIFNREDVLKNGLDTNRVRFTGFIENDAELTGRLDRVLRAMQGEHFLPEVYAAMLETVLYLYSFYRKGEPEAAKNADDPVRRAIDFLNDNWNRPVSMDEVAAFAGMSKFHFMRRFKAATGETPLAYLQQKRCRVATVLLKQHRYPISVVAQMVGYETPSYFAKVYLSVTGEKPSRIQE